MRPLPRGRAAGGVAMAVAARAGLEAAKQQGRGDHHNGGTGHCSSCSCRGQMDTSVLKNPGSQWNHAKVEDKGPQKVAFDAPNRSQCQLLYCQQLLQIRTHQHHIRRLQRQPGAGADGDPNLRRGQCHGVVDAVPDEDHTAPRRLELRHQGRLVSWSTLRTDILHRNPKFIGHSRGSGAMITSAHPDLFACVFQFLDHLPGIGMQGIP
mmetsp:Transcript_74976/g.165592  ORF Transcript_74976/g.165592 Transcript_74976/m.165592 type:complete len:208 (-) Transcript_74976:274-897(-)